MNAGASSGGRPRPTPVAEEREFGIEELFISTTDLKGIIRSGNRVFSRVAGYSQPELAGTNHNVIRHPDMPRAAFQLLWDMLHAGKPVAAYAKNLAKDGRFYWVMAIVVPVDDGYVSVRMKPTTAYFEVAQAVYPVLLAVEQSVENGDVRNRKASIAASTEKLGDILGEHGYASYDAFMHAALAAEVAARHAAISGRDRQRPGAAAAAQPALAALERAGTRVYASLRSALSLLQREAEIGELLGQRTRFTAELADDIRLFSINAQLAANRLGEDGNALQTVAGLMRARSQVTTPLIDSVSADLRNAVEALGEMAFRLAAGLQQSEMLLVYLDELATESAGVADAEPDLRALAQATEDAVERLFAGRERANDELAAVARHGARLEAELRAIRALLVNGRIEATRVGASGETAALFATIAERVDDAREHVHGFRTAVSSAGLEQLGSERDGLERTAAVRAQVARAVNRDG